MGIGAGREAKTKLGIMGLTKIHKQISQAAKNLPEVIYNGTKINHERLMKRILKVEGMKGVNNYMTQVFYDDQLAKIKMKENADRHTADSE